MNALLRVGDGRTANFRCAVVGLAADTSMLRKHLEYLQEQRLALPPGDPAPDRRGHGRDAVDARLRPAPRRIPRTSSGGTRVLGHAGPGRSHQPAYCTDWPAPAATSHPRSRTNKSSYPSKARRQDHHAAPCCCSPFSSNSPQHGHDPINAHPGLHRQPPRPPRHRLSRDAPEPGPGEVKALKEPGGRSEGDRPQRPAEGRDDADGQRPRHRDATGAVGKDGGAPDELQTRQTVRHPLPEFIPCRRRRTDPAAGPRVEDPQPLKQRAGNDEGGLRAASKLRYM